MWLLSESEMSMNMIYNSANYCVVEFEARGGRTVGGFEIVDKYLQREIFLNGSLADDFRRGVVDLIASSPSVEEIDNFLSRFDSLMLQPVVLQ